ncbi:hypothetical protein [Butyrivibrio sp. YAB3001]|uniref:hypothetical protein n=1 Tax=Butyrivibrio sp. YAB3001 TaxID=1520812 RepID=UPI0008F674E9|nr:hypothetical protein [Butyrivibrio sp. YAB3001]SFC20228.1 hypothetical protein SAMN02910398_01730 [Butyrivibrio sp. YAB3001]
MGENGDNQYFYNNYNYNKAHNELDKHVHLATIALVLALISLPLCFFMYTGIILGGVAIVFAILSKGNADRLLPQAKKALIYGSLGIVLGYAVVVTNIHGVITNPEYRQRLNKISEQYYGESFDDMLKEIGASFGEL